MTTLLASWWTANAVAFLVGTTVLMAVGALSVAWSRAPIHRRRLAEAAVGVFWVWLCLALVPLPLPREISVAGTAALVPGTGVARPALDVSILAPVADSSPTAGPLAIVGVCLAVGAALMLARLVLAIAGLHRVLRRSVPAPTSVTALALPLTSRAPRVLVSRDVARPFCCGLLRPCVVLPASLLAARSTDGRARDLRPVLLHELAHLAQGDLRGHLLFALSAPLLFWNPLFWWLRREAGLAAELVADDLAVRHLDKSTYVRELIDLAEGLPAASPPRGAALAVVGRPTEFFRRMNMLLQRRDLLASRCSTWHALTRWSCAVLVAIAGSLAWSSTSLCAQDPVAPAKVVPAKDLPTTTAETAALTELTFAFADEAQLGAKLAKLALSGIKIHALEVVRGDDATPKQARIKVLARDKDAASEAVQGAALATPATKTPAAAPVTTAAPSAPAGEAKQPPRVYFNFKDTDVTKVVDTIAKISGTNIVMPPTLIGKVTVQLRNVPVKEALERTVEQLGHTVTEDAKGVLVVSKKPASPK